MTIHAVVIHNKKHYTVQFGCFYGTSIIVSYTVNRGGYSARPVYVEMRRDVDASGKLGQSILRKAAENLLSTEFIG